MAVLLVLQAGEVLALAWKVGRGRAAVFLRTKENKETSSLQPDRTRLADGTMVRREPFGFFLAFPDGEMDFFDAASESLLKLATTLPVPRSLFHRYRLRSLANEADPDWDYALKHPLIVCLELTRACNCFCPICYIDAGKRRRQEMDSGQLRKLWHQLVEAGVCCVQLTGGEPLLHPMLPEAIDFFHSRGVVLSLATNATLLTEEMVRRFPTVDFGMGISIDSYFTNQAIRGGEKASFENLQEKILLLQKYGIHFNIVTTLSKLNINEAVWLIKWCRQHEVMLETLEAQPFGRGAVNAHLLLAEEDLPADAIVYRAKEELEDEFESRHDRHQRFFAGFLEASYRYNCLSRRCKGGRTMAYIASDGTMYPCSSCAGQGVLATGNVTSSGFGRLWSEGFEEMRAISWSSFEECLGCDLAEPPFYCPCRCPPLSQVRKGTLTRAGCSPYLRGAVRQRTRIHAEMHASQAAAGEPGPGKGESHG